MKKFYKTSILVFVLFISHLVLYAAPIDSTIAKTVAKNFYGRMANRAVGSLSFKSVDLSHFQNFYVFNDEGGNGFVIVSADDRAIPILGYSENGSVIIDNLPVNFVEWLSGYESEIEWVKQNIFEVDEETTELWRQMMDNAYEPVRSDRAVSPLLHTEWGQGAPYNYFCPYNNLLNTTCPTGCVATAMAQVMKYWEWPTRGYSSHSYDCSFYGTQTANFSNTNYGWFDMPNSNPSSSNRSIAELMYHCGVSVDMDYGYNGSGSFINLCVNALKNYFRYSSSVQYVKKEDYSSTAQWQALLKTELDNDRPIIYKGEGNGNHAFVCDGYNNNNYFHFNWGWEGNYDDYFSLSALSPSSYNFSSYQEAIIGIEPNSSYGGYNLVLYSDMNPSATSVSVNQTFSLSVNVANFGSKDFDGRLAIVAVDEDDDSHYYILNPTSQQISGGTYVTNNFSLSIPEIGTYSLMVYYISDYDDYYHYVFDYDTYVNGTTVTVSYPPDQYEPNDAFGSAYNLASVSTNSTTLDVNANFHVTTDKDFYKINLPANYNYTINAVIYTSYNTSTYTADGKFATSTDGSTWSNNYGTQMPEMTINNGGTLYFRVLPYTSNEIGTYQLHITIQRESVLSPDQYEPNNAVGVAYNLATVSTNSSTLNVNANFHITSDNDFYKVTLPNNYNYTINATIYTSNNTSNYTAAARFVTSTNGSNWSGFYENQMPQLTINDGGTLYFRVLPCTSNEIGTYQLHITIQRTPIVGIEEMQLSDLMIFPNPASDFLHIASSQKEMIKRIEILTMDGKVMENLEGYSEGINVSSLAAGIYLIRLYTPKGVITKKWCKTN